MNRRKELKLKLNRKLKLNVNQKLSDIEKFYQVDESGL